MAKDNPLSQPPLNPPTCTGCTSPKMADSHARHVNNFPSARNLHQIDGRGGAAVPAR